MNFQHIEAICGIAKNGFNISATAEALSRSQPGLSRQLKELEAELGVKIFHRTRNKVVSLTPQGEIILRIGRRIICDYRSLHQLADDESAEGSGELRIATTHVHARYSLPKIFKKFTAGHPGVLLTLRQGDPMQCSELVATGEADIGISTVIGRISDDLVAIPIFKLTRCILAAKGHPIAKERALTLKKLAEYPIIAYSSSFSGRWIVDEAFAQAGIKPHIICSAIDADVSKAYVELGMGIAILAQIAFDPERDRNLVALPADQLFRPGVLNLVLRKHGYLSGYARDFVSSLAPHVSLELIGRAMEGAEIDKTRLAQRAPVARFA